MALTFTTLPQMTKADAENAALIKNNFYIENELGGVLVSKTGQTEAYFETTIPKTREEEYNATSTENKNKFALIGALANIEISQNPSLTFEQAWEVEYNKIFS